jgi:hypothetical protein
MGTTKNQPTTESSRGNSQDLRIAYFVEGTATTNGVDICTHCSAGGASCSCVRHILAEDAAHGQRVVARRTAAQQKKEERTDRAKTPGPSSMSLRRYVSASWRSIFFQHRGL